jgi:hypothetical protein
MKLNFGLSVKDAGKSFKVETKKKAGKPINTEFPTKQEEKLFPKRDARFSTDKGIDVLFQKFEKLVSSKQDIESYKMIFEEIFKALDREDAVSILSDEALKFFFQGATEYHQLENTSKNVNLDAAVVEKLNADKKLDAELKASGLDSLF